MKRILLMDDEQVVLDFLGRMLSRLGYEVAISTEGTHAVAAYARAQAESKPFDVVMLDLVIVNGLGGQDTVLEIRKIDPKAKVIATSGHLDHPVMVDHKKFSFDAAITKPYKMETLGRTIAAVIGVS